MSTPLTVTSSEVSAAIQNADLLFPDIECWPYNSIRKNRIKKSRRTSQADQILGGFRSSSAKMGRRVTLSQQPCSATVGAIAIIAVAAIDLLPLEPKKASAADLQLPAVEPDLEVQEKSPLEEDTLISSISFTTDEVAEEERFHFGDFSICVGEEPKTYAPTDEPEDLYEEPFNYGDFRSHSNSFLIKRNRGPIAQQFDELDDNDIDDGMFAFSDFAVVVENEMEEAIVSDYNERKLNEQLFVFGDFAVALPEGVSPPPPPEQTQQQQQQKQCPNIKMSRTNEKEKKRYFGGYSTDFLCGRVSAITCISLSSNEQSSLSCCSSNKFIYMNEIQKGDEIQTYIGHRDIIKSLAVGLDDKMLASCSLDCSLCVWDMATARQLSVFFHPKTVTSCSFSRNGRYIATSCYDHQCRLYPVRSKRSREPVMMFREHTAAVTSVHFEPNGEHAISSSADGTVWIWSASNGKGIRCLRGHQGVVYSARYSPDAEKIVSSDSSQLRVWSAETGNCIWMRATDLRFTLCTFAPGEELGSEYVFVAVTDKKRFWFEMFDVRETECWDDHNNLVLPTRHAISCVYSGKKNMIVYGDCEGNVYSTKLR